MKPEHDLRADSTQTERPRLLKSGAAVQPCMGAPKAPRRTPERNRFIFGGPMRPAAAPDEIIAGESSAKTGYELLAGSGTLVSWHDDVLDAFDAMRLYLGPAKVVRCVDRALLRIRHGRVKT